MQTELRVIDLGKRGGKVVRQFYMRKGFRVGFFPSTLMDQYACGLLTETTFRLIMAGKRYPPEIVENFVRIAERR